MSVLGKEPVQILVRVVKQSASLSSPGRKAGGGLDGGGARAPLKATVDVIFGDTPGQVVDHMRREVYVPRKKMLIDWFEQDLAPRYTEDKVRAQVFDEGSRYAIYYDSRFQFDCFAARTEDRLENLDQLSDPLEYDFAQEVALDYFGPRRVPSHFRRRQAVLVRVHSLIKRHWLRYAWTKLMAKVSPSGKINSRMFEFFTRNLVRNRQARYQRLAFQGWKLHVVAAKQKRSVLGRLLVRLTQAQLRHGFQKLFRHGLEHEKMRLLKASAEAEAAAAAAASVVSVEDASSNDSSATNLSLGEDSSVKSGHFPDSATKAGKRTPFATGHSACGSFSLSSIGTASFSTPSTCSPYSKMVSPPGSKTPRKFAFARHGSTGRRADASGELSGARKPSPLRALYNLHSTGTGSRAGVPRPKKLAGRVHLPTDTPTLETEESSLASFVSSATSVSSHMMRGLCTPTTNFSASHDAGAQPHAAGKAGLMSNNKENVAHSANCSRSENELQKWRDEMKEIHHNKPAALGGDASFNTTGPSLGPSVTSKLDDKSMVFKGVSERSLGSGTYKSNNNDTPISAGYVGYSTTNFMYGCSLDEASPRTLTASGGRDQQQRHLNASQQHQQHHHQGRPHHKARNLSQFEIPETPGPESDGNLSDVTPFASSASSFHKHMQLRSGTAAGAPPFGGMMSDASRDASLQSPDESFALAKFLHDLDLSQFLQSFVDEDLTDLKLLTKICVGDKKEFKEILTSLGIRKIGQREKIIRALLEDYESCQDTISRASSKKSSAKRRRRPSRKRRSAEPNMARALQDAEKEAMQARRLASARTQSHVKRLSRSVLKQITSAPRADLTNALRRSRAAKKAASSGPSASAVDPAKIKSLRPSFRKSGMVQSFQMRCDYYRRLGLKV